MRRINSKRNVKDNTILSNDNPLIIKIDDQTTDTYIFKTGWCNRKYCRTFRRPDGMLITIIEYEFKNDKQHGLYNTKTKDGKLIDSLYYKKGRLVQEMYKNGKEVKKNFFFEPNKSVRNL
jgi:hypothetical protein